MASLLFCSSNTRSSRSSTLHRPDISRVLPGRHLDDQFTYRESSVENGESSSVDEEADISEDVSIEGNQELKEKVAEGTTDSGQAAVNKYDLEAPLEKKASKKSAEDQNLVSALLADL
ncbi:MAG: hypothetical protein Q9167_003118 [Letrouitia subvulpina]